MEKYLNMGSIKEEVNKELKREKLDNEEEKVFNLFLRCLDEEKHRK